MSEGFEHYTVDRSGCWLWQGAINNRGYGQIRIRGRLWLAHRAHYERAHGPIPAGLVLDHLCRVHACVNPAHLEAVTDTQNKRRGKHIRLSEDAVAQIRATPRTQGYRPRLAARFGVSPYTIDAIIHRRTWKEVEPA